MRWLLVAGSLMVLFGTANEEVQAQSRRISAAARMAPRSESSENRWRYVWHNDRWWYWTSDERWSYFAGGRWRRYDPRRPPSDALAAGYRKAPAFESPPAAAPQPPLNLPAEAIGSAAGMVDLFELGGRGTRGAGSLFGGALPPLGGFGAPRGASSSLGGASGTALGGRAGPTIGGASGTTGRTGGGSFGGPTGGSLGAGSAAGGASSPQ